MKKKFTVILLIILTLLSFCGCFKKSEPIQLYYYYFNACGACNESEKFYNMASTALKGIDNSAYNIITVNTFKEVMPESLKLFLEANNLKAEDISYPILVSGNNYIMGLEEIEKNMRELLLSSLDKKSYNPGYVSGESTKSSNEQVNANNDIGVSSHKDQNSSYFVYFYTSSCDDCSNTENYLKTLSNGYNLNISGKSQYSPLVIEHKNITQGDNLALLQNLFEFYNVPEDRREVPILFYSKGYISGDDQIKKNLENVITSGDALNFDYALLEEEFNINSLTLHNIPGIFLTGLINGINPCSISMLFLLLSLVISKKSNVIKFGFSYIGGKMVAFFSFGIAAYNIIAIVDSMAFRNVQYGISIFMIIISILLALLNFRDAYWAKKEAYNNVKMQLPGSLRNYNHRIISFFAEKADSGWAVLIIFLLGVIISLGEFLCTGQIYVATIIYMAQNTTGLNGITVLSFVIYVLAASIPLIILVILVNRTKQILLVSEFVRKHLPVIKIIFGVTFLIFGLIFAAYII